MKEDVGFDTFQVPKAEYFLDKTLNLSVEPFDKSVAQAGDKVGEDIAQVRFEHVGYLLHRVEAIADDPISTRRSPEPPARSSRPSYLATSP